MPKWVDGEEQQPTVCRGTGKEKGKLKATLEDPGMSDEDPEAANSSGGNDMDPEVR
jgi:hypothetical protein